MSDLIPGSLVGEMKQLPDVNQSIHSPNPPPFNHWSAVNRSAVDKFGSTNIFMSAVNMINMGLYGGLTTSSGHSMNTGLSVILEQAWPTEDFIFVSERLQSSDSEDMKKKPEMCFTDDLS